MTMPLAVLEAMEAAGCTAAQLVAAIRADRDEMVRRRCARAIRRALFPPAPRDQPESGANASPVGASVGPSVAELPQAPIVGSGGITRARGRKGLGLARGLSGTARQVGAALIEYWNAERGLAWPTVAKLAETLDISPRSVKRATAALDAAGLIRRHVRRGRRTTYEPVWAALGAAAADWDLARLLPQAGPGAAKRGQERPPTGARTGPLYQEKIPDSSKVAVGARRAKRPKRPDPREPEMLLVMRGGAAANRQALAAARLDLAVSRRPDGAAIKGHAGFEMARRLAIEAELARPGQGVQRLEAALAATGPPASAGTAAASGG